MASEIKLTEWVNWIEQVATEAESFANGVDCISASERKVYVEGVRRGMRQALSLLQLHGCVSVRYSGGGA